MKLSVLMITYNHEAYIEQALDSALMQQVNFDYEIVIGEDCSTDGTRSIVQDYQRRYPDKIRLLLQEHNLGVMQNWIQTMRACRGEYIATLEGDDYWTNPLKLQKQVDFLDDHSEYSLCGHEVIYLFSDGLIEQPNSVLRIPSQQKDIFTLEDMLRAGNFIKTCSYVFRTNNLELLIEWPDKAPYGDTITIIFCAHYGLVKFMDEVMGVYRVHSQGVWSGGGEEKKYLNMIIEYDIIHDLIFPDCHNLVRSIQSQYYIYLVNYYVAANRSSESKHAAIGALKNFRFNGILSYSDIVVALLKVYCPAIYKFAFNFKSVLRLT